MREDLEKRLRQYCTYSHVTQEKALEEAVERLTAPYAAGEGYPKKAILMPQTYPVTIPGGPEEVWVLGETSMYGLPYYRIVKNGELLKVPAGRIKEEEV